MQHRRRNTERHGGCLACRHVEWHLLLQHELFVFCIQQLQGCSTADGMVASIDDTTRNLCLVTLTDKARHVGQQHHFLAGHSLAGHTAKQHISGIGNTHETPGGKTLGKGEADGYRSSTVCCQRRIEESGLLQVLAHLHFLLTTIVLTGRSGLSSLVRSHYILNGHGFFHVETADSLLFHHGHRCFCQNHF